MQFRPFLNDGEIYTLSIKHISGTITGNRTRGNLKFQVTNNNQTRVIADVLLPIGDIKQKIEGSGSYIGNIGLSICGGDIGVVYTNYKFQIQLEVGNTTDNKEVNHELCACTTYTPNADGNVEGITSLYPVTTLLTETENAVIECTYNVDTQKAIESEIKSYVDEAILGGAW